MVVQPLAITRRLPLPVQNEELDQTRESYQIIWINQALQIDLSQQFFLTRELRGTKCQRLNPLKNPYIPPGCPSVTALSKCPSHYPINPLPENSSSEVCQAPLSSLLNMVLHEVDNILTSPTRPTSNPHAQQNQHHSLWHQQRHLKPCWHLNWHCQVHVDAGA